MSASLPLTAGAGINWLGFPFPFHAWAGETVPNMELLIPMPLMLLKLSAGVAIGSHVVPIFIKPESFQYNFVEVKGTGAIVSIIIPLALISAS